ncbi:MAG: hypothetical protein A7315_04615 [Candidatus Altiarchaeales archaeon WOR_SM1_79]|nr:MAG: hypothetical protein A7315_04615 [Candidatus Altiarchaeales archaeon WOR_SM1_79]
MNLKLFYLTLKTSKPVEGDASMLRGFIGNRFSGYPILHHHIPDVGFIYTYPKVQYKIIEGTPVILGMEEGAEVLLKIFPEILKEKKLKLLGREYKITEAVGGLKEAKLGVTRKNHKYGFITPWIALNQENYTKFQEMEDWKKKKNFLNNILAANILSMCKGLDYVVDRKLYVHSLLNEEIVRYKGMEMTGFKGEFKVNFKLPDLLGLGKGVSQGFGVVKKSIK